MKVYVCQDYENEIIKIFSSNELAADFKKKENIKYNQMMAEQRLLWDRNPGKKSEIREKILAGLGNEDSEVIEFAKECQEFNKKWGYVQEVFGIIEYEVD